MAKIQIIDAVHVAVAMIQWGSNTCSGNDELVSTGDIVVVSKVVHKKGNV